MDFKNTEQYPLAINFQYFHPTFSRRNYKGLHTIKLKQKRTSQ